MNRGLKTNSERNSHGDRAAPCFTDGFDSVHFYCFFLFSKSQIFLL